MQNNHALYGLSSSEAARRLKKFGLNELQVKIQTPLWKKFLFQFTDIMVLILIAAAGVSILIACINKDPGQLNDAYVILGIVLINALIGFFQEFKAERALEALQKLISPKTKVLRDGEIIETDAKQAVPGDLLILAEGDKIAADCVLLESNELKIEEAALTGESFPVSKNALEENAINWDQLHSLSNPFFKKDTKIPKTKQIFMGTSVVSGSGKALVIKTGSQTEFGKIARLTVETEKDTSPLQKELRKIAVFVGKITLLISSLLFFIGILFQGRDFIDALIFSISVAVAAVPEGLPATITVTLAIGVQRMAKKRTIIKQLSSVETLGSTTVICSDKTGTLTKNQMTVKQIYFPAGFELAFEGVGYEPKGQILIKKLESGKKIENEPASVLPSLDAITKLGNQFIKKDVHKTMDIISLCNDAKLKKEKNKWKIMGDPTEGALLTAAHKSGHLIKHWERIKSFPFDSIRKTMSIIAKDKKNPEHKELFTKGAPDKILKLCTHIQKQGKITKITEQDKKKIMAQNNAMANRALRLLATAYRPLSKNEKTDQKPQNIEQKLIFLSLIGMMDPPRKEVTRAIKLSAKAGIRMIVITGDYGRTTLAVAKEVKLAKKNTKVITGNQIHALNNQELKKQLKENRSIIFARVNPEDKMRIVDILKQLGEIVAVTGDGVNDAPALKRADIGIAMGITGTDVSKEAANVILTDDSLSSIVDSIKEGRIIYNNLKKFVWYILSCNIGELTTIFIAILLQIPAPLTAILILAVNLGTDLLPSLALGVDPEEPGLMEQPPRDPKSVILNKSFVTHFITVGISMGAITLAAYLWDLKSHGWQWGDFLLAKSPVHLHAMTIAFCTLIFIQMFNAHNARSFTNSVFRLKNNLALWGAISISLLLTIAFVELPFFQKILHTSSLSLKDWTLVILASMAILFIEETRKILLKLKKN